MPLSDYMGETRGSGFARLLAYVADSLGMDGEVRPGGGDFVVRGHRVTIDLDVDAAVLLVHSNVAFPPHALPQEVACALAAWRLPAGWLHWDGRSDRDESRFVLRCRVGLHSFDASALANVLDAALPEVAALDRRLRESGYAEIGQGGYSPALEQRRPGVVERLLLAAARRLGLSGPKG